MDVGILDNYRVKRQLLHSRYACPTQMTFIMCITRLSCNVSINVVDDETETTPKIFLSLAAVPSSFFNESTVRSTEGHALHLTVCGLPLPVF